jgi:hypothetical protein
MARNILVIADSADHLTMANYLLTQEGDRATGAVITAERASDTTPYIGDVLRQCKEGYISFDAVLLFDPSKPKEVTVPVHNMWREASNKLQTLDADMESQRITFSYTTNDDVTAASNRAEDLQRSMDKMHADQVKERRQLLQRGKDAAEHMLLTNPPSEKGLQIIKSLRASDSPLKDLPIAIYGAHPDREESLLNAGADIVHTSADSIYLTPNELIGDAHSAHENPTRRIDNAHTAGMEPSFRARAFRQRMVASTRLRAQG